MVRRCDNLANKDEIGGLGGLTRTWCGSRTGQRGGSLLRGWILGVAGRLATGRCSNYRLAVINLCALQDAECVKAVNHRRRHGEGAKGAACPPPQPPIGDPLRSIQIRGDFGVGKMGG